jgi:hypothetical protein
VKENCKDDFHDQWCDCEEKAPVDSMIMPICTVCRKDTLVLAFQSTTSYGTDASGNACCAESNDYASHVYCSECHIQFQLAILKGCKIIKRYPFWKVSESA